MQKRIESGVYLPGQKIDTCKALSEATYDVNRENSKNLSKK